MRVSRNIATVSLPDAPAPPSSRSSECEDRLRELLARRGVRLRAAEVGAGGSVRPPIRRRARRTWRRRSCSPGPRARTAEGPRLRPPGAPPAWHRAPQARRRAFARRPYRAAGRDVDAVPLDRSRSPDPAIDACHLEQLLFLPHERATGSVGERSHPIERDDRVQTHHAVRLVGDVALELPHGPVGPWARTRRPRVLHRSRARSVCAATDARRRHGSVAHGGRGFGRPGAGRLRPAGPRCPGRPNRRRATTAVPGRCGRRLRWRGRTARPAPRARSSRRRRSSRCWMSRTSAPSSPSRKIRMHPVCAAPAGRGNGVVQVSPVQARCGERSRRIASFGLAPITLRDLLPFLEEDQRRDRHDPVRPGGLRVAHRCRASRP